MMRSPKLENIPRGRNTNILDLSNELLLLIAENLALSDFSHFASTSRHLSSLLTTVLYNRLFWAVGPGHVGMYTALELAAVRGDASLAELAVSKGAKVAMLDPYSRTPLHLAAMYNRPEVIRILVKSGAHINATNASFETPLFQAAAWESVQAMKVLLELGADMTGADTFPPAHKLAGYGEVECMSVFIDAGLDLSFRDMLGATVLHEAVAKKDSGNGGVFARARGEGDYQCPGP